MLSQSQGDSASNNPVLEPSARLRLGPYELLVQLASGGMATVYVARQLGAAGFQRLMVIKRVHHHLLSDNDFRTMFIDEAHVASLIRHPNVVSVTDVVEADGELFLAMDYIESTAFSTLIRSAAHRQERLSPHVAARIMADVLSGLHAAHEASDMQGRPLDVVHRDVSPQNILVARDGISRLIDFGVAKAAHRLTQTRSGGIKGKLSYISPEAAQGIPIDRRADVFSAGIVLHEALTGKRLFLGENELDTLRRVVEREAPAPSSFSPFVSPELDAVVKRALDRDRDQRFPTAAAFFEALEAAVPLASAREVSATLEDYCGARLADRRSQLRALLDGQADPSLGVTRPSGEPGSVKTRISSEPRSEGTESKIAATRDSPSQRPHRGIERASLVFATLAGALVVGLLALAVTRLRPAAPATPRASSSETATAAARDPTTPAPSTSASGEALPVASSSPDADAVEVVLVSDRAAIESVRAKGLRHVSLDGARARVSIAPWKGRLAIEAVLAGGRTVVTYADASAPSGAPIELRLSRDKTLPAPASPPPSDPRRPRPNSGPELHDNPYEQP
jgi:eukaryotic-like serine/threonine-protein kinase